MKGNNYVKQKVILNSLADVEKILAMYENTNRRLRYAQKPGDFNYYDTMERVVAANERIHGAIANRAYDLREKERAKEQNGAL